MTSRTFAFAVAQWRMLRTEFENYRASAYLFAEEECRGAMLNERGKKAGVDAYSLFMGNEARARAYASPELLEHWERWGRLTFAEFERQHYEEAS